MVMDFLERLIFMGANRIIRLQQSGISIILYAAYVSDSDKGKMLNILKQRNILMISTDRSPIIHRESDFRSEYALLAAQLWNLSVSPRRRENVQAEYAAHIRLDTCLNERRCKG